METIFPDYPHSNYQAVGIIKGIYFPKNKRNNKGIIKIEKNNYTCRVLPRLAIFSQKEDIFKSNESNMFISWVRFSKEKQPYFILKHLIKDEHRLKRFEPFTNKFDVYGTLIKKSKDSLSILIKRNTLIKDKDKNKEKNQDFTLDISISDQLSKKVKKIRYGSFCKIHCHLKFEEHTKLVATDLFVKPNKKNFNI